MKLKLTTLSLTFMLSMGLSMTSGHAYSVDPNLSDAQLEKVVKQAEYYVREFEKEVEQQRGGDKAIYRSKKDALDRVQILKQTYPDDPGVEKLFQRTKTALMKSKGDYTEVDPSWTKYKTDEANLRKTIAAKGEQEWNRILSSAASPDKIITKEFPIPDPKKISIEELKDSYVVLKDVEYPANQFYGGSGEYIWHGKPSAGYYFVQLDGRNWVGPYEAIKRYRRLVDSSLADVTKFTILGKIVDITAEIPAAGENKTGRFEMGWVVEPVAVQVPDHVVAVYDANAESSGKFIGEDEVAKIKDSWYTVKSIPQNVTPDKLMEIFIRPQSPSSSITGICIRVDSCMNISMQPSANLRFTPPADLMKATIRRISSLTISRRMYCARPRANRYRERRLKAVPMIRTASSSVLRIRII